jgi:hypothetical protein
MLSVWLPFPLNSGMLDNCTHLLVVCVVHSSQRRTYRTIRAGSFFERSRITLDKWLYVTYIWSQGTKVNSVERQVQIGKKVSHDDLSDSSLIFGTLYILKL